MIYWVEDDSGIRDIEVYTLNSMNLPAQGYADGEALFAALRERTADLILLDLMLPGEDGLTILKKLRGNPTTRQIPVILATAKGTEYDRITGLDLGADDYLVKPFSMLEMVSRVRAVLRRAAPQDQATVLHCGGICLNVEEHSVLVDDRKVDLTLKEFEVLRTLMRHPGMVFTRDQLLSDIWGMDYDGETRTVDVHIRTLRQKLGPQGNRIGTVRGVGYRLEPPVNREG